MSITPPSLAVPALLESAAARFPNRPAMDFLGKSTNYAELAAPRAHASRSACPTRRTMSSAITRFSKSAAS